MKPNVLMKKASAAMGKAYCPYSKFHVGAALLCSDGSIYTGCNIENASYGLTICAERVAIDNAIAHGNRKFTAMAIIADGKVLPRPCGACRQVLFEFCQADFMVYMATKRKPATIEKMSLQQLLPEPFNMRPEKSAQSKTEKLQKRV